MNQATVASIVEMDPAEDHAKDRRLEDVPDYLSIDELSAYLQIPKNTLYYWRSQGTGPVAISLG
jgi:hypothetical protein